MRVAGKVVLFIAVIVFIGLPFYNSPHSPVSEEGIVWGGRAVEVTDDIVENTTWEGDILIKNDVTVEPGFVLTIKAGTTVTFDFEGKPDWDDGPSLSVEGKIIAQGKPDNMIRFTSDTPHDNPSQVGSYSAIELTTGCDNSSIMEYCNFSYGETELELYECSPTIKNCEFYRATSDAISIYYSNAIIEHNDFYLDFPSDGISIGLESNPTVRYNNIYLGDGTGIFCFGICAPVLLENKVYGGSTGYFFAGSSQPDVTRCLAQGATTTGFQFSHEYSEAPVSLSQCIATNCFYGVMLSGDSEVKFDTCEISANSYYGIFVTTDISTSPEITNSNLYGNGYVSVSDDTGLEYSIKDCYWGHDGPFIYVGGMVFTGDVTKNIIIKDALEKPVDIPGLNQLPVVLFTQTPKNFFINYTQSIKGRSLDPDTSDSVVKTEVSLVITGDKPENWVETEDPQDWEYEVDPELLEQSTLYYLYVRCTNQNGQVSGVGSTYFSVYYTPGAGPPSNGSGGGDADGGKKPWHVSVTNYWTWIEAGVLLLTLLLAVIGFFTLRSKKRKVHKYLKEIEGIMEVAKTDPTRALASLNNIRKEIKERHAKNKIDDQHYLIIDKELTEKLQKVEAMVHRPHSIAPSGAQPGGQVTQNQTEQPAVEVGPDGVVRQRLIPETAPPPPPPDAGGNSTNAGAQPSEGAQAAGQGTPTTPGGAPQASSPSPAPGTAPPPQAPSTPTQAAQAGAPAQPGQPQAQPQAPPPRSGTTAGAQPSPDPGSPAADGTAPPPPPDA